MILTAATMKLEVLLGGAPATNQLPFACAWVDITSAAFTPGQTNGVTSGVTPVDLIGSPAASTQRQAKGIDVFNADTAPVTVTVRLNDNGTTRVLCTVTMAVGDTLEWRDSTGWQVMDLTGARKSSGGGGTGEANTASNAGTVGVGLVEPKVGVDLPFRSVGPGSARVTVALDAVNHVVTVDSSPDADTVDGATTSTFAVFGARARFLASAACRSETWMGTPTVHVSKEKFERDLVELLILDAA